MAVGEQLIDVVFGAFATSKKSKRAGYGKCQNFLKEMNGTRFVLYGRPGYKKLMSLGLGPIREVFEAGGYLYVISGNDFYRVSPSLAATKIGQLNTHRGKVRMDWDGFHVSVADGDSYYVYEIASGTFKTNHDTQIPPNPIIPIFFDGFTYVIESGTGRFHTHSLAFEPDGNWAGDQATAEYSGDDLISGIKDHAHVFLFGPKTTEVWESDSQTTFPLKPNRSAYMEIGCAAAYTPIQFNNAVALLARDENGGIFAAQITGLRWERISGFAEEAEWAGYDDVSDAYSVNLGVHRGHPLWMLVFPSQNKSWVYDASIASEEYRWSEFTTFNEDPEKISRFKASSCVEWRNDLFGRGWIIGSYSDNTLYVMRSDFLDDDGTLIQGVAASQEIINLGHDYIPHPSLEIYMETGVGLEDNALEGYNPAIKIAYSDDHGNTWTHRDWIDIGKDGQYTWRVIYHGLGSSRHRIYQLYITDPVDRMIISAKVPQEQNDTSEAQIKQLFSK